MIGIIGYGFVGKAVSYGFSPVEQIIVDPKHTKNQVGHTAGCDAVFICVPTPMNDDGSCNTSIVEVVLRQLRAVASQGTLIVLKSTVPPADLVRIGFGDDSREVYNPEFLTERGANADFVSSPLHVFGSMSGSSIERLIDMYEHHSLCDPVTAMFAGTVEEAAIVKYMINTFLAMKVEFFNEWKAVADKYGGSFHAIAKAVAMDPRIGSSHTKVPGPDGKPGFGGSCFPKDVAAIVHTEYVPLVQVTGQLNAERRRGLAPDQREIEQNVKWEPKT